MLDKNLYFYLVCAFPNFLQLLHMEEEEGLPISIRIAAATIWNNNSNNSDSSNSSNNNNSLVKSGHPDCSLIQQ